MSDRNLSINVCDKNVSIPLYADHMVLLSDKEEQLQIMLNTLIDWCQKWRVSINKEKG